MLTRSGFERFLQIINALLIPRKSAEIYLQLILFNVEIYSAFDKRWSIFQLIITVQNKLGVINYRSETLRIETCSSNQNSVKIRLRHQFSNV